MPAVRAVLFDLDDTLCDSKSAFQRGLDAAFGLIRYRYPYVSEEAALEAWKAVHRTLFPDLESGRWSMAEVRDMRFVKLLQELEISEPELAPEANHLLGTTQLKSLKLFDDAYVLEELRNLGLYVGIVTNGAGDDHPDSQRSKAQRLGLLRRVDSFWVSDEMGCRKPQPEAFLPALRAAGCAPHEAIYVGDSADNDVVGANRTGIVSALLVRLGEAPAYSNGEVEPNHVVSSLDELVDLAIV